MASPQEMLIAAPMRIEVTSTLELPGEAAAKIPAAVEQRVAVGEYSSKYTIHDRSLSLSRRVGLFARSVPAARYGELASFFDKMTAADQAVVNIKAE